MDVNMPTMDGLEGTRAIQKFVNEKGLSTTVVGLTAFGSTEMYENCKQSGMSERLVKPLILPSLKSTMSKYYKVEASCPIPKDGKIKENGFKLKT